MHITQSIDKLYAEIQPTHLTHSTVYKLAAAIPCTQLRLLYINYMSKFPVYSTHILLYINYLFIFPISSSHILLYINYVPKFPLRISVYCTLNYMPKFPVLISHVLLYINYLPKFPVSISHFQEHIKYQILQGLCLYETNL